MLGTCHPEGPGEQDFRRQRQSGPPSPADREEDQRSRPSRTLDLFDLKSFRERIMAREPDRQAAEIHIRIALMNRFNAIGTAEIVRIA
jgi:hypothetical protein